VSALDEVRSEMEFVLADRVEDVLVAAIPGLAERLAAAARPDGSG